MKTFIAAIDQGTTSTRCIVFNPSGLPVTMAQQEHAQIYPQPGWVEHDPLEIWRRTEKVFNEALTLAKCGPENLAAIGITNQRETTIIWEKATGRPIYNALVWQDTRTADLCRELMRDGGQDRLRAKTGLPLATYFSGPKIKWLLDNIPRARQRALKGELLFGTMDTWLIWNLTGVHVTDVTNASRTLLMDLKRLEWDEEILELLTIPPALLPKILSSSQVYGRTKQGIPVAGDLGDQQAALFGQTCFQPGEAKNTYGTGCFLLMNTGENAVYSPNGLLTTLGYQIGGDRPVYALEGSIAITGALVQWLRDNLGIIKNSSDVETLARSVEDNGGTYFVPAFSGLYAPYWKDDARGVICGLTRYVHKGHIARAALEATAFQTWDIFEAMNSDSGLRLSSLRVDGGMVENALFMQFQSDILNVPLIRPQVTQTTALGAAYAAGLAVGYWSDPEELKKNWNIFQTWEPQMREEERKRLIRDWQKAVTRTFNWVD
jgi:glycerol kinase